MSEDKKELPLGWECPRCGSVNSPQTEKCKCVKTEQSDTPKPQLLAE